MVALPFFYRVSATIPGGCLGFLNHQRYHALPFFLHQNMCRNVQKSMTIKFIVSEVKNWSLCILAWESPDFSPKKPWNDTSGQLQTCNTSSTLRQFWPVSESLIWFVGPLWGICASTVVIGIAMIKNKFECEIWMNLPFRFLFHGNNPGSLQIEMIRLVFTAWAGAAHVLDIPPWHSHRLFETRECKFCLEKVGAG